MRLKTVSACKSICKSSFHKYIKSLICFPIANTHINDSYPTDFEKLIPTPNYEHRQHRINVTLAF